MAVITIQKAAYQVYTSLFKPLPFLFSINEKIDTKYEP